MPIRHLGPHTPFPDPLEAEPEGLLAYGGDLSPERLLAAYRKGIFPWYEAGFPILWWSPPERALFRPGDEHLGRRTQRTLRTSGFEVRVDTAFDAVVEGCATVSRPGQDGTWITPEMREAYGCLHRRGIAHSFETWRDGVLVGGLYGLSLGAAFFGESMFSRVACASRAAFARLCATCWGWGFHFIDGQLPNPNLEGLGARVVSRDTYLGLLRTALRAETRPGPWTGCA